MNRMALGKGMHSKKRKHVGARKLNIRWELLGLSAPPEGGTQASIESIREAVSSLASRGIGQGARARMKKETSEDGPQGEAHGVRRRGATE